MEINIRKAEINDLETIRKLSLMLFDKEKKEYDIYLDMEWTYSDAGKKHFVNRIKKGCTLIVEVDGKMVGYLAGGIAKAYPYRTVKDVGEIDSMYVMDEYRNKGIGSKLVTLFFEWCNEKGLTHIKVEASAQNINGIKFYKKMGFNDYTLILEKVSQ
jgi:ribosomal protein S18 acetylase RimI-like enzyme